MRKAAPIRRPDRPTGYTPSPTMPTVRRDPDGFTLRRYDMLDQLKEQVWKLHQELPRNGLVVWTGGNVSARDPESGLVVIKPSGVLYDELRPEDHVVVNLEGEIVEGALKPSSDTASHLYISRHRPDVNGVVHTHSSYATAFAALGRSIPVYLTAIADEFGGPIPCAGFALIGGEEVGREGGEDLGTFHAGHFEKQGVFTRRRTTPGGVQGGGVGGEVAPGGGGWPPTRPR